MNAYMRGFVILFVLLVLLSYLPPGKQYRKYIRFYAQLLKNNKTYIEEVYITKLLLLRV